MDYDLLEAVAKNYDQDFKVVRRVDGVPLLTVSPKEILDIFGIELLIDYHVPIDLRGLEKEYMLEKDNIRKGVLRAHTGTIKHLLVIKTSSRVPLRKEYFTS